MNKLYNTQDDIATNIKNFLINCGITRKTQLKIIPFIVIGMILSYSTVASNIAGKLKGDFSLVQNESVIKRIKRFFTNKIFNPYDFYDKIICFVISTYKKKHENERIHIVFDHMFSHDNFTVFMITMRIGKQGIPLWFRCFKGNSDSNAFAEELLKEGITYVSELFDSSYKLVFLADRWFGSTSLLQHIESLGRFYAIRLKKNINVSVSNKKTGALEVKNAGDLKSYRYHSNILTDVEITKDKFKTNIVISKSEGYDEPWIIATNDAPSMAINNYQKRFGAIETVFKNQKSNGLNIEAVPNASLKYFTCMYTICCFVVLFLTILGADYCKNKSHLKSQENITTHKTIKGKKVRVLSLFKTGLKLINTAFNSCKYIHISYSFVLYDI